MTAGWAAAAATVVTAIAGFAAAVATSLFNRGKTEAETDSIAIDAMESTIRIMRSEMDVMHEDVERVRAEYASMRLMFLRIRSEYLRLRSMILEMGGDPGPEISEVAHD